MGNFKRYSDEEINHFLEVAKDEGIGKTIRTLGYPESWSTAYRWVKSRGIEVPLDEIKQKAKAFHDWYETEELLIVGQETLARISEKITTDDSLNPDDIKKLSESYQKVANTWLLLQGKANNISESRKTDSVDVELMELMNIERARNQMIETEAVDSNESIANKSE